ncbi:MAG TPA: phosphatase PAP2 family protein [Dongiaceae bacterium]|jgi:membrane-associated phospholipid phosphatase|nr:phosphatase PAP2 family protein [Dongiaceae bacterium]
MTKSLNTSAADRRGLLIAIAALLAAMSVSIVFIDRPLAAVMMNVDPRLHAIAERVTWFGRSTSYLVTSGVAALALGLIAWRAPSEALRRFARGWAWLALYLFLAVALSGIANDIVKEFVGRARPQINPQELRPFYFGYDYQSFPSGHAATVFGLAFGLSALLPRLRWLFLILAAVVASSRVILNVHHLGDVIGSVVVALLVVHWLTAFFASRHLLFERDPSGRLQCGLPHRANSRRITPV